MPTNNETEQPQEHRPVDMNDVEAWHQIDKNETDAKWLKGDIAARYAPDAKQGRRKADDTTPTLGDFAYQVGCPMPQISEYRSCAMFYPPKVRLDEEYKELTWTHFNIARRFSAGKLDNAEELLHEAERHHLKNVEEFRNHLKDMFAPHEDDTPEVPNPDMPNEDDPSDTPTELNPAAMDALMAKGGVHAYEVPLADLQPESFEGAVNTIMDMMTEDDVFTTEYTVVLYAQVIRKGG